MSEPKITCHWCGHRGGLQTEINFKTIILSEYWANIRGKAEDTVPQCIDTAACERRQDRAEKALNKDREVD